MRKLNILLIFQFLFLVSQVKSQTWEWLYGFKTAQPAATAIDNQGNSYTIIKFKDSISELTDINPWADDSLHSKIIKRNSNNILVWEKDLYCTGLSYLKMCFKNNSEPYLTGSFSGSFSSSDFNLISNGAKDIFLIQITNAGGFSVSKHFGGSGDEHGECGFDSRGYLIVTGGYTYSGTFGSLVFTGNISQDFFLLEYDTNGVLQWSERAVTPDTTGYAYCVGSNIKTDNHNNIYITISGNATLENNGVSVGATYAQVLCKFNSSGSYRQYFYIGSWYPLGYQRGWDIDDNGNVYYASVGGTYHTSYKSHVVKQDSLHQIIWQHHFGAGDIATADFVITGFHLDNQGNYFFTARGDSVVGSTNKFIAKGNSDNGNLIWKYYQDITGYWRATIKTDDNNNIYVASDFRDTLTIGSFSIFSLNSTYFNPFLVKMAAEPNGLGEKYKMEDFPVVYPNPSMGKFTLCLDKKGSNTSIFIYDVLGNCILTKMVTRSEDQIIDLSDKAKGIYFIEVQSGNERINQKIIIH